MIIGIDEELELPCEISAKYIVPALRLMIAKKLIEEHNLTQSEAARLLGITQASISHYLNSKRGAKMSKVLSRMSEVKIFVDEYVEKVLSTNSSLDSSHFCSICKKVRDQLMKKKQKTRFI